jgi:hypothetical protein
LSPQVGAPRADGFPDAGADADAGAGAGAGADADAGAGADADAGAGADAGADATGATAGADAGAGNVAEAAADAGSCAGESSFEHAGPMARRATRRRGFFIAGHNSNLLLRPLSLDEKAPNSTAAPASG